MTDVEYWNALTEAAKRYIEEEVFDLMMEERDVIMEDALRCAFDTMCEDLEDYLSEYLDDVGIEDRLAKAGYVYSDDEEE